MPSPPLHAPHKLRPGATREAITTEAARRTAELAVALRERGLDPLQAVRFLDRVVFSLFAEDIGLLPEGLFTRVLETSRRDPPLSAGSPSSSSPPWPRAAT